MNQSNSLPMEETDINKKGLMQPIKFPFILFADTRSAQTSAFAFHMAQTTGWNSGYGIFINRSENTSNIELKNLSSTNYGSEAIGRKITVFL